MKMTKKQKAFTVVSFLLTFALMGAIFYYSNQQAEESSSLSDSLISEIYTFAGINIPVLVIRKAAHICEYAALCFLFSGSFYFIKHGKPYVIALISTFLFACSDEIHQLFVPGRWGSPVDVLIDTLAAVLGAAVYFAVLKIINRLRGKKDVRNQTVQGNKTD